MDEVNSSSFVSRVSRATKQSDSLRVTIPQVVASMLHLRPGDELLWELEADGLGNPKVHVHVQPAARAEPAGVRYTELAGSASRPPMLRRLDAKTATAPGRAIPAD